MPFYSVFLSFFLENITVFEILTKGRDVASCLALSHETHRVVQ